MSDRVSLTGMVLKAAPVGDYDKRLVLLTGERGKVTAFARGARRPKGSLVAASNLFCFGRFEAYEGRDSFTVVKAEVQNYFRGFAADLDLNFYGCYCLEVADYFCPEGDPDCISQLKLLYRTLQALLAGQMPASLIRRIYELKMLVLNGTCPDLFACAGCGKQSGLTGLDTGRFLVYCDACQKERSVKAVDPAVLYTLQYIISSPLESLFGFRLKPEVEREVSAIIRRLFSAYVDRPLLSRQFLPD